MTDLRSLIATKYETMTATQQRIADFVRGNPLIIATAGIEEISRAVGVSAPSITRFVKLLGLNGFPEFKALAVDRYRSLLYPVESITKAHSQPAKALWNDALSMAETNLGTLHRDMPLQKIEHFLDRLQSAKRVALLGFGASARVLQCFSPQLEAQLDHVTLLDGRGGHERLAGHIRRLGPYDLLVAMALPRYSKATMEFVELAKSGAVPVYGVTDQPSSPLCPLCDDVLFVPSEHRVLNCSTLAAHAFFEGVATLLYARTLDGNEAEQTARLLYPYLYTGEDGTTPASAPFSEKP